MTVTDGERDKLIEVDKVYVCDCDLDIVTSKELDSVDDWLSEKDDDCEALRENSDESS